MYPFARSRNAENPRGLPMPRRNSDSDRAPGSKSGLLVLLGGGCAVLLLCLIASGSGVGIWYWKFREGGKDGEKVVEAGKDKKLDDGKAKAQAGDDPKKRTLGKATDADLDPAIDVWDYS